MKPIVETVLKSGLIDRSMASLMEHFGMLPEGSAEQTNEGALEGAGREKLLKVAEDIASAIEREHQVRETALDLERMRWPAIVGLAVRRTDDYGDVEQADYRFLLTDLPAAVDRMGRYFFRVKDIPDDKCLVPGNAIIKKVNGKNVAELILQSQQLFLGENPVCWQVSVR